MRKVFLWAMLVVFTCWTGVAWSASSGTSEAPSMPSDAFAGVGLHKVYITENPVILRENGEPFYSSTDKFVGKTVYLAAQIKNEYAGKGYSMPQGTLTDTRGMRYGLSPSQLVSNIFYNYAPVFPYSSYNFEIDAFTGSKVMWNIFTSPDVTVGAAVIPDTGTFSEDIANDAIVPYVKITNDSSNSSYIGRIDLYFVRSGDWSIPVPAPAPMVKLTAKPRYYSDISKTFTNFGRTMRNSMTLSLYESRLNSIEVEYVKDGSTYIWQFEPKYASSSYINWGELAHSSYPFTVTAGDSADITITLPGGTDLTSHFDGENPYYMKGAFMSFGNNSIAKIDDSSVSFKQGRAGWIGGTWSEDKSVLSFKVLGLAPGRTTLKLNIPEFDTYYREVHVVSGDRDMHLESTTDTHDLKFSIVRHTSQARMLNGKPWYPSAEFESMRLELSGGEDANLGEGYIGISSDLRSEIHKVDSGSRVKSDGTRESYRQIGTSGVYYYCYSYYSSYYYGGDYPGYLSLTSEDLGGYNLWAEFPNQKNYNIVSASLKPMISGDYMTTAEQLKTFVPYFELKHAPDSVSDIVSLDWSFVNPQTMQKVTPNVSNLRINGRSVEGTSGTIPFSSSYSVYFTYVYNGVNYEWDFYSMDGDYYVSAQPPTSIVVGTSKDVSAYISSTYNLSDVSISIWDEDILSANPVEFDAASNIAFNIEALKEGVTRLSIVTTRNYASAYNRYSETYYTVRVTSQDVPQYSVELEPSYSVPSASAAVIEGKTDYTDTLQAIQNQGDTTGYMTLTLSSGGSFDYDDFYNYVYGPEKVGTLHVYSGSNEIYTQSLEVYNYSYNYSTEYSDDYSERYVYFTCEPVNISNDATLIVWESSNSFIKSGSADVSRMTARTLKTQYETYKPYAVLTRDGLNALTIDYYFVDGQNNKVEPPSSLSDVNVYVSTYSGSDFYASGSSGTIKINTPDVIIDSIYFYYKDDGISYSWYFSPVDKPSSNYASNVTQWDIASPDLPLVMRVGETVTLTLSGNYYYYDGSMQEFEVRLGNPEIVSMNTITSSDYTTAGVKVTLTAKSAGMTSIALASTSSSYKMTWPREIWVADAEGKVPHLTGGGTIDDIIKKLIDEGLTSENYSWYDSTISDKVDDSNSGGGADSSGAETGEVVEVLAGLSVQPRFAVPTDPSGDVYGLAWQKIDDEGLSYSAYMFKDDVMVLEGQVTSNDVPQVFNDLSADLISSVPPQIPAVVFPMILTQAEGLYTFRIPIDNVKLSGTKIFMRAYDGEETYLSSPSLTRQRSIPNGVTVVADNASADIYTLSKDYSVTLTVNKDENNRVVWQIASKDIEMPDFLSYSVEETDASGDITVMKFSVNSKFDELYELAEGTVSIPVSYGEDDSSVISWHVTYLANDVGMTYYTDEGTKLASISGQEFINVVMHLEEGIYAPVLTAQATPKDVRLIKSAINGTAPISLTASESSLSIKLPASGTVTLTPVDAVGTVTYSASETWVTFSGNTATFSPTTAGNYNVTITATDSDGLEGTTVIAVNVAPMDPLALRASRSTLPIRLPASGTVTLTPSGAIGTVTYSASVSWVTFSGNTATFSPTAAGDYTVTITATDSEGRSVTTQITVNVTPADSGNDTPGGDNSGGNSGGDNSGGNSGGDNSGGDNSGGDNSGGDNSGGNSGGDNSGGDNSGGNSGGDNGGSTTPSVETVSGRPSTPTFDLGDSAIVEGIIRAIGGFDGDAPEVRELPDDAIGEDRTVDDMSDAELAAIPTSEEVAVVLPTMAVDTEGVYTFGVDLDKLTEGMYIFLHLFADDSTASNSSVMAAEVTDSDAYTFLTDDGEETTTVPASKHVNVAAYMKPDTTYSPVITASNESGSGDNNGTGTGDNNGTGTGGNSGSSGGGGCDSGFGVVALAALVLTLRRRSGK